MGRKHTKASQPGATAASSSVAVKQDLLEQAVRLQHGGASRQAIAAFRRYLRLDPGDAGAWHALAATQYQLGELEQAVQSMRRAVQAAPADGDLLNDLGSMHLAGGQLESAADCYRKVLAISPAHAGASYNLGIVLHQQGRTAEAVGWLEKAIRAQPGFAEARCNLGIALASLGRFDQAAAELERAVALQPDLAPAHLQLGEVYRRQKRSAAAVETLRRAVGLNPVDSGAHISLAMALHESGRTDEGIAVLRGQSEREKPDVRQLVVLARLLYIAGDMPSAERVLERALAIDDGYSEAWLELTRIHRFTEGDEPRIAAMEAAVRRRSVSPPDQGNLHYALGKALDDLGECDSAFEHYRQANEFQGRSRPYDPAQYESFVSSILEVFDAGFMRAHANLGSTGALPAFIVGMPRSGTTLTEQILASHPDVQGAGELAYFSDVQGLLPGMLDSPEPYPGCCRGISKDVAQRIVDSYLTLLRRHSPSARLVTDKMPENYLYLGLIRLLFPRAPVIHCRREPLDTCLSIYFQSFAEGHAYANDLAHIGHRYLQYERLIAHWRNVLPGGLLEIDYEALVEEPEPEARRLLEYCGLSWNPACLDFHKTRRAVKTASYWQVRQPIYTTSRQRWKNYERHLKPLTDLFAARRRSR